jgi:putative endonuclease
MSSPLAASPWCVYIVRCADDTLYTGIAKNLAERMVQHNTGRGAKYTRSRRPVELVYRETVSSRSIALRRENAIKRLAATEKWALITRAAG